MYRSLLAASIVLATTAGANAAIIDFEGTTGTPSYAAAMAASN